MSCTFPTDGMGNDFTSTKITRFSDASDRVRVDESVLNSDASASVANTAILLPICARPASGGSQRAAPARIRKFHETPPRQSLRLHIKEDKGLDTVASMSRPVNTPLPDAARHKNPPHNKGLFVEFRDPAALISQANWANKAHRRMFDILWFSRSCADGKGELRRAPLLKSMLPTISDVEIADHDVLGDHGAGTDDLDAFAWPGRHTQRIASRASEIRAEARKDLRRCRGLQ